PRGGVVFFLWRGPPATPWRCFFPGPPRSGGILSKPPRSGRFPSTPGTRMDDPAAPSRAAPGRLALAFALVYLSWGTTYIAIQEGVKTLPPALFGGVRVACAGLVLMTFLALRGQSLRLPWREVAWAAGVGVFLF